MSATKEDVQPALAFRYMRSLDYRPDSHGYSFCDANGVCTRPPVGFVVRGDARKYLCSQHLDRWAKDEGYPRRPSGRHITTASLREFPR